MLGIHQIEPSPAFPVGRGTIGFLVSVALALGAFAAFVPRCFCGCYEHAVPKARMDMDTIRQAIELHDTQEPRLRGCSLYPLLGRYIQEIPLDPWGRPYMVAADAGLLLCFGRDGKPGGVDEDADIVVRYRTTPDTASSSGP